MQFGNFVFQVDPEKLTITHKRHYKMEGVSSGQWCIKDSMLLGRVVSGESYFFGPFAYSDLQMLSISLNSGTPDTLSLPHWGSMNAILTDLVVLDEPGESIVRFSFSFVEVPS